MVEISVALAFWQTVVRTQMRKLKVHSFNLSYNSKRRQQNFAQKNQLAPLKKKKSDQNLKNTSNKMQQNETEGL